MKTKLRDYYIDRLDTSIQQLDISEHIDKRINEIICFFYKALEYQDIKKLYDYHTKSLIDINMVNDKRIAKLYCTLKKDLEFHTKAVMYYGKLISIKEELRNYYIRNLEECIENYDKNNLFVLKQFICFYYDNLENPDIKKLKSFHSTLVNTVTLSDKDQSNRCKDYLTAEFEIHTKAVEYYSSL